MQQSKCCTLPLGEGASLRPIRRSQPQYLVVKPQKGYRPNRFPQKSQAISVQLPVLKPLTPNQHPLKLQVTSRNVLAPLILLCFALFSPKKVDERVEKFSGQNRKNQMWQ